MITWLPIGDNIGDVVEAALSERFPRHLIDGHKYIQFDGAKFKRDKQGWPYMVGQYGIQNGIRVEKVNGVEIVYPTWEESEYDIYAAPMRPTELMNT